MSLTKVQTIGIETGISFTGVTTITSLNATQGANISISSPGVALTITQSGSGGYVQVGTSSTVAVIDNSGRFLVGVASTTSDSRAVFQGSSASATGGTNVYLQRGSTPTSGDKLGLFAFSDVHGKVGAEISAYADATWSLNDYPGRLVFSTTPDGSSTVTERLRIDDGGNLILDSDLDTYIHHPAADTLAVTTGGSERLRIDSSGRLGIGVSAPSSLLHVEGTAGNAKIRLGTGGDHTLIGPDSSGHTIINAGTSGANMQLQLAGTTKVTLNSTGLGIGTSSPGRNLTVQNSSTIVAASLVSNPANIAYLLFGDTDSDAQGRVQYDNSSDSLQLYSSGSERVRIDSSGRVGIGVTGPQAIFHSKAGATTSAGIFESTSASGSFLSFVDTGTSSYTRVQVGSVGNELVLRTTDQERCRVDSSGRLLVGTSSARVIGNAGGFNSSLQIETTTYAGLSIVNNSNDATGALVAIGKSRGTTVGSSTIVQSGDTLGEIRFAGADGTVLTGSFASIAAQVDATPGVNDYPGRLVFSTTADGASSPTERMRIGNIGGIDVSATGNGDNHLRNTAAQTTASGANLFIDGTSGVLRRSTSSIKYKTDVETLQDSFADKILNCRPVWYRSTSAYDNQQWGHWGFIAEEVAEVDPRLCFYGKNEDGSLEPEGVQYDRFVPHLLNLIKRQQQAIEDLQAEVAALKTQ